MEMGDAKDLFVMSASCLRLFLIGPKEPENGDCLAMPRLLLCPTNRGECLSHQLMSQIAQADQLTYCLST